jgi:hypothetical protein
MTWSPLRRALSAVLSGALAGGVLLAAAPAHARTAAPCPERSLHKEIKRADVVFRGVVEKVRPVHGKGDQRTRTYKVTADRVYRSSLVTDSVRVTTELGARCPPPDLAKGKRYIFFVTEEGSRLVSTSTTSSTGSWRSWATESSRTALRRPTPSTRWSRTPRRRGCRGCSRPVRLWSS